MANYGQHPRYCSCSDCHEQVDMLRKRAISLVKSHTLYSNVKDIDPNVVVELLVAHSTALAYMIKENVATHWNKKLTTTQAELSYAQNKVSKLEAELKNAKEALPAPVKVTSDQSGRLFREE